MLYFKDQGSVGLSNYTDLLGSTAFYKALRVSFIFTSASLIIALTLATVFALMARAMAGRGTLFISALLLPWALSPYAVALIWQWILSPSNGGLLNTLAAQIGMGPYAPLTGDNSSLLILILVGVWRNFAFATLVIGAGLTQIPKDLYKAAAVDQANRWEQFRHITWPLVRPSIVIAATILTISYFNEVQLIIGLTGGGPVEATTTLSWLLYKRGVVELDQGQANAIALMMLVVSLGLVFLINYFVGLRDRRMRVRHRKHALEVDAALVQV
ncbi:MAG: sugar ABC transporter permease [Actinomycetota bacterium]|nr:sugar ABC transporter permease [Actinomycetota bacterium]